ncbi:hypothetical protein L207DRAFT_591368 [Hyaloscypha variabilis F]|uniref:Uncharacterized protein n=1 Tax=Hyaloscypha variabilis (strain UAMH 11265 / GT02V1 / F) TaxID=1149755 RepID=A0A2J6QYQ7_HYAVF|nr:hypothetical protein L207DRAFT_591368 [Hyaloscypha variabilis F]
MDQLTQPANFSNSHLKSSAHVLMTVSYQTPYIDPLRLLQSQLILSSNKPATCRLELKIYLASKIFLILFSPPYNKPSIRKRVSPPLGDKPAPKLNQSSFPLHIIQYFTGWSRRPSPSAQAGKLDASEWVIIEHAKVLLKWKCCECDFVNQAVDGEDEDALFCEGDVSGILVDGDKVAICGHGRCEGCEVLEGG